MADNRRLIDANALWEKINNSTASNAVKATALVFVDTAPTVETIGVVRCNECKHFKETPETGICRRIPGKEVLPLRYNDFCSFGEEK